MPSVRRAGAAAVRPARRCRRCGGSAGARSVRTRRRRAAAAVGGYLRQRLELSASEPTPAEAETHLRRLGISEKLALQTADCLKTCAALRFAREAPPAGNLAAVAAQLILALEAETWAE